MIRIIKICKFFLLNSRLFYIRTQDRRFVFILIKIGIPVLLRRCHLFSCRVNKPDKLVYNIIANIKSAVDIHELFVFWVINGRCVSYMLWSGEIASTRNFHIYIVFIFRFIVITFCLLLCAVNRIT